MGAQRPVRRGNAPKKTGARSARARTRGQNPLVMNNCRGLHSHTVTQTQLNPPPLNPLAFILGIVIGARGLSDDDDGKNDGLTWKLAESVL